MPAKRWRIDYSPPQHCEKCGHVPANDERFRCEVCDILLADYERRFCLQCLRWIRWHRSVTRFRSA